MQADREGACLVVGQEVGLDLVQRLQQAVRHRGLGPAGDHFEGVDEVLALRAEPGEQAVELAGGRAHLPVEAAVGGVDDLQGIRNVLYGIVRQTV